MAWVLQNFVSEVIDDSFGNSREVLRMAELIQAGEKPIIFFDGVCGMCNLFVNFALKVDRRKQFVFAPLQGDTAQRMLPPLPADPRDWSMIYVDEKGVYDQSDASLQVYKRLGGIWWLLSLARIVPRFIRTPLYRIIARNRYRLFGKQETCRVPTAEERARFLP